MKEWAWLIKKVGVTSACADFVGLKRENDVVRIFTEFTDETSSLTDGTSLDVTDCLQQNSSQLFQLQPCS